LLKRGTPGGYTFLLRATREVPRRLVDPRRRSIGIRVPEHPVALALLEELDEPLLSSSLIPAGETEPMHDPEAIRAAHEHQFDLIVDGGICSGGETTVIDLSVQPPNVVREGRGPLSRLGLSSKDEALDALK
jgi:tRNA threonylcarbamoyl adenosine modification protein (Sua5/YciO/YrdC/YwlC family)